MKHLNIFILAAAVLALSSCGTYKRIAYIQDMVPDVTYSMPAKPDAKIAKNDKLSITVTCSTPALAAPFNLPMGEQPVDATTSAVVGGNTYTGNSVATGSRTVGSENQTGYEVDRNGDINFPIIGKMHVEGLTLKDVKEQVEAALSPKYMKDPVVFVSFVNFQITMLGEIGAGNYLIPSGSMNMFEALAMAGDVNYDAVRNEIWVIRTNEGKRRLYTIDLQTKDCYYSPVFFLQQNDMIYVKPRNTKFDNPVNNRLSVISTIFSGIGAAVNGFILYRYFAN